MGLFVDWGIYREASPRCEVERRQDVFHCPCPPGPSTRHYGRVHNQPCFCYIPRTDLVFPSRIISLFSWGQSLALSPLFRSFFLTRQIYAWFSGTGSPHSQMDDPVTTVQPSRPLAAFLGSLLGRLHLVCIYKRVLSSLYLPLTPSTLAIIVFPFFLPSYYPIHLPCFRRRISQHISLTPSTNEFLPGWWVLIVWVPDLLYRLIASQARRRYRVPRIAFLSTPAQTSGDSDFAFPLRPRPLRCAPLALSSRCPLT